MINNQTIWGNNRPAAIPKNNVRPNGQKRDPKPRKTRSDKKQDIKMRLSHTDKKILKLAAMKHDLSITAFASLIVQKELTRKRDYKDFEYAKEGPFVHVMLPQDFFEMVKTLSVEWDLSYRRVVHRMIMDYIDRSTGGVEISDWRGK